MNDRNRILHQFVLKKLENHGITSYSKFIIRCRRHFNSGSMKDPIYYKIMNYGQSFSGNISIGPSFIKFVIVDLLKDSIDDPEICQLLLIKNGRDIRGERFGRLIAEECLGANDSEGRLLWKYRCDCGNTHIALHKFVNQGDITSCGCFRKEASTERARRVGKTHGMAYSVEYRTYINLKSSCYNKNHPRYKNYGAKGIKLCDSWKESFENFFKDIGSRPEKAVLRRKDSSKDFTPDNCYWHKRNN